MTYGNIAHFDRPISRLVLGSIGFKHDTRDASFALLDAALEAGINTVDLAHIYNRGQAQEVMGEWLSARGTRDRVVLFDKGCHPKWKEGPQVRPDILRQELDVNLQRLGIPSGDLFVFHRDDPTVPVGPLVDVLNELKAEGKVQAWGASNWSLDRLREFNENAESRGLQGFSLNNPNLSLATVNEPMWADAYTVTEADRAWHQDTQFPLFAWSSQASGYFFGVDSDDVRRVYENPTNIARRERARDLAAQKQVSMPALILAWALGEPYPVWALIGPKTSEELHTSLEGVRLTLTQAERSWLEHGDTAERLTGTTAQ